MRSVLVQLVAVITVSVILTYLTGSHGYTSMFNSIWVFGFPVVVGILSNHGRQRQLSVTVLLMIVSVASLMISGVYFGIG